jgi:hypothetical protein
VYRYLIQVQLTLVLVLVRHSQASVEQVPALAEQVPALAEQAQDLALEPTHWIHHLLKILKILRTQV